MCVRRIVFVLCTVVAVSACETKTPVDQATGSDSEAGDDADAAVSDVAGADVAKPDTVGTPDTQGKDDAQAGTDATGTDVTDTQTGTDAVSTQDVLTGLDVDITGGDIVFTPDLVSIALSPTQTYDGTSTASLTATLNAPATVVVPDAIIDWGDGVTATTGKVTGGVAGSWTHHYQTLGKFSVHVSICVQTVCKEFPVGDVVVACGQGWDDCNGASADGCEVHLSDDPAHCGTCAVACASDVTGCNAPETCEAGSCTPHLASAGTICRAVAGPCDVTETCDGQSDACPADVLSEGGTVCRASGGVCDVAESCTGESPACPADAKVEQGTLCQEAAGPCEQDSACTGVDNACPATALQPSSHECRGSAGDCDPPEFCTGASADCPEDAYAAPSTVCREANGPCDLSDFCTGASPYCPKDAVAGPDVVCRAAPGLCDVPESCNGESVDCPPDQFLPPDTVCRAAAGPCDVAETCTGASSACPADAFDASGKEFPGGDCGTSGFCDGKSASGGATLVAEGTVCRASTGACDPAEVCDGKSSACPPSSYAYIGKLCRVASNACDIPEYCGFEPDCPVASYKDTFGRSNDYRLCAVDNTSTPGLSLPAGYCASGTCVPNNYLYSPASQNLCTPQDPPCVCNGGDQGYLAAVGKEVQPGFTLTFFSSQYNKDIAIAVNPAKVSGGIRVTGHIQLGNMKDRAAMVTRSGSPIYGVAFWYDPALQHYGISGVGATTVAPYGPASAPLTAGLADTLSFDLTDDGNLLTLQMWTGTTKPAKVQTVQATSSFVAYNDAGPIVFDEFNDAFQPGFSHVLTDWQYLLPGGIAKPSQLWDIDTPATSGTTLLSDHGEILTLHGPGIYQGEVGTPAHTALSFDQTGDGYAELATSELLDTAQGAISLRVYVDSGALAQHAAEDAMVLLQSADGQLRVALAVGELTLFTGGSPFPPQPPFVMPLDTWTTVTLRRGTMQFFTGPVLATVLSVDGVDVAQQISPADTVVTGPLQLGHAPTMSGVAWPGFIDDVSLYATAADPLQLPSCTPAP